MAFASVWQRTMAYAPGSLAGGRPGRMGRPELAGGGHSYVELPSQYRLRAQVETQLVDGDQTAIGCEQLLDGACLGHGQRGLAAQGRHIAEDGPGIGIELARFPARRQGVERVPAVAEQRGQLHQTKG